MRDIRIFPIFEGANDVMRSFVALSALKPLGDELKVLGDVDLGDPIGSLGALAELRVRPRQARGAPGARSRWPTRSSPSLAGPIADQVKRLRYEGEGLLREHGKDDRPTRG